MDLAFVGLMVVLVASALALSELLDRL